MTNKLTPKRIAELRTRKWTVRDKEALELAAWLDKTLDRIEELEAQVARFRHLNTMGCEIHDCFEDEQHGAEVNPDDLCPGCFEVYKENERDDRERPTAWTAADDR